MAVFPTITDDDGTGTTGTILDQALFHGIRDYVGTSWTDVTFNAGNFTASGSMTWTVASGDVSYYRWVEIGKTMFVCVAVFTTTVGGTPSTALKVAVPNGRTAQAATGLAIGLNNSAVFTGFWQTNGSTIDFYVDATGTTNWAAATNTTAIRAMCSFEIA